MGRDLFVVCGVRPHYVKWAGLKTILSSAGIRSRMLDVRQHYDSDLTDLLLTDLNLSASETFNHRSLDPHERAGSIYSSLCVFLERRLQVGPAPAVLVFGDVTATVMSALAASRIGCPVVHVEAGVRSAPGVSGESIENRIRRVTAQVSALNLCVLQDHVHALEAETAPGRSHWVGDLGRELLLELAGPPPVEPGEYVLVHIHKAENTDPERIRTILRAVKRLDQRALVVVHPTIREVVQVERDVSPSSLEFVDPLPYSTLAGVIRHSRFVLTDSGGLQREAYHLGRRCVVRRDTVGWAELVGGGGHVRVGVAEDEILYAMSEMWRTPTWRREVGSVFYNQVGVEVARQAIVDLLQS